MHAYLAHTLESVNVNVSIEKITIETTCCTTVYEPPYALQYLLIVTF